MKLKSFGCSFIFGSDLSDDGYGQNHPKPSQLTWPAHLARHLDKCYECYARPGAGNLQILEQIINQSCSSQPDDLFVIGWTWINRFDYYDAHWNPKQALSPWKTIMPIDTDETAKVYYKDLHSEYKDKFLNLSLIKLAIDTLRQKNISFVMTYMDDLMFDQRWHTSPAVIDLQKQVRPCMTLFEDKTFLQWSRYHAFAESEAWHPLEKAHCEAGRLMIKVFQTQNTETQVHKVHTTN